MKSAIIHFEPVFSKYDQSIFLKRTLRRIKKTFQIEEKEFFVYLMPIFFEQPSEKAMHRMVTYLKEEGIERVLFSKSAKSLQESEILRHSFLTYDGQSVINYKLYDILRKCANSKNLSLEDSTVCISCDDPDTVKKIVFKLYKYVRRITVKTKKPEVFSELVSFFLHEYGLYIEINHEPVEEKNQFILDIDGTETNADFSFQAERHQVLFSKKHLFAGFMPYHDLDQQAVEFLAEGFYGSLQGNAIREFFDRYLLRITKIKNND